MSRSLAIRPDHKGFVLGTEYLLRAFDADGKQLWEHAGPAIAWGVNLSADGRIIVAAYGDGTIRWQRWSDGTELLALFVNRKTKAWVAWTPSGYYMASPGGEDLIGWHVNRGWNQAADFFPASKFRDKYARADIVERVLDTLDEDEAVRQADLAPTPRRQHRRRSSRACRRFCRFCRPPTTPTLTGPTVTIDYLVRSPSGTTDRRVEALINGATGRRPQHRRRQRGQEMHSGDPRARPHRRAPCRAAAAASTLRFRPVPRRSASLQRPGARPVI